LNNREATGKIAKWAIALSMYDIVYKPRTAIKAQALSDFVAEWTEIQTLPNEKELVYWTINFDGSLQVQGAGVGILVTFPIGESFKYVLQMHFPASNNVAEYEALLHGLRIARPTRSGHVWMIKCCYIARSFADWKNYFDGHEYMHILQRKNEIAVELA
jgi:hypothetical protein